MCFSKVIRPAAVLLFLIITIYACKQSNKNAEKTTANPSGSFIEKLAAPTGYVNDYDSLFTVKEKETLENLISVFEKKTTIEIAILTLDSSILGNYSVDSFTLAIGNKWGVGKKDKNNGIVIGICAGCKKIRIENGFGIQEILTNAKTKNIIDSFFLPKFKYGEFYEGTLNGVKALIQKLSLYEQEKKNTGTN